MSNIKLDHISVKYEVNKAGDVIDAIEDLSLFFKHGDISVLLGESGSGKTSILNCISGLILYGGSIYFNGVNANKLDIKDRNISYVSQEFSLYPQMSVFDNIAFPIKVAGASREEIISRVNEMAEVFGIKETLNRKPKLLSIGQRQRVALARALIKHSDIYLFDEPFSNLDIEKTTDLREMLKKVLKQQDATAVFVTHDAGDAFALADKVFILEEGQLIFEGSVKDAMESSDNNIKMYFAVDAWNK